MYIFILSKAGSTHRSSCVFYPPSTSWSMAVIFFVPSRV